MSGASPVVSTTTNRRTIRLVDNISRTGSINRTSTLFNSINNVVLNSIPANAIATSVDTVNEELTAHTNNNDTKLIIDNAPEPTVQPVIGTTDPVQPINSCPGSGTHSRIHSRNNSYDVADEISNNEYKHVLQSDILPEESRPLLQSLFTGDDSTLFYEFNNTDINELINCMTILRFEKDEIIVETGELSTFVGIILSGELMVNINDNTHIIMSSGSLIGELSFFDKQAERTAAIHAHTESIVALITYNELQELKTLNPLLRLKLISMFAVQGLHKLRSKSTVLPSNDMNHNTINQQIINQPSTQNNQNTLPLPGHTRRATLNKISRQTLTKSTPILPVFNESNTYTTNESSENISSEVRQVEALFRVRLAQAAKQRDDVIESTETKLKLAQQKVDRFTMLASALHSKNTETSSRLDMIKHENDELNRLNTKLTRELELYKTKYSKLITTHDRLKSDLLNEKQQRTQLQVTLNTMNNSYQDADILIKQKVTDLYNTTKTLQNDNQLKSNEIQQLQQRITELNSYEHHINLTQSTTNQYQLQITQLQQVLADNELNNIKLTDELEHRTTKIRSLTNELYDVNTAQKQLIDELQSIKNKSSHIKLEHNKLVSQYASMKSMKTQYSTVIKYLVISRYVKHVKRIQSIHQLTQQFELLCAQLSQCTRHDDFNEHAQRSSTIGLPVRPSKQPSKLLHTNLDALFVYMNELVEYITTHCTELIQLNQQHRTTLDAFSSRNIELAKTIHSNLSGTMDHRVNPHDRNMSTGDMNKLNSIDEIDHTQPINLESDAEFNSITDITAMKQMLHKQRNISVQLSNRVADLVLNNKQINQQLEIASKYMKYAKTHVMNHSHSKQALNDISNTHNSTTFSPTNAQRHITSTQKSIQLVNDVHGAPVSAHELLSSSADAHARHHTRKSTLFDNDIRKRELSNVYIKYGFTSEAITGPAATRLQSFKGTIDEKPIHAMQLPNINNSKLISPRPR